MSRASHSLVWYPRSQRFERHVGTYALTDPSSFVLHRTLGPELGFGMAHAQIGAELLPEAERPAYGGSIKLLWVPLLPSRCLFVAEDPSGSLRIASRQAGHEPLALTLEHMEVECAWAFEELRSERLHSAELARRLDGALALATDAVLLFSEQAGEAAFWQRRAAS